MKDAKAQNILCKKWAKAFQHKEKIVRTCFLFLLFFRNFSKWKILVKLGRGSSRFRISTEIFLNSYFLDKILQNLCERVRNSTVGKIWRHSIPISNYNGLSFPT